MTITINGVSIDDAAIEAEAQCVRILASQASIAGIDLGAASSALVQ